MSKAQVNALLQQARNFAQSGNALQARELFQQVCRLDASSFEGWQMLGGVHGMLGDFDEAEACSRKAIKLKPKSVQAWFNLASALIQLGRFADAISAFGNAIKLDRNNATLYLGLGKSQLEIGEPETAVENLRHASRLAPANPEVSFYLAMGLSRSGRFQESLDIYRSLLKQHPNSVSTLLNASTALLKLGSHEEALELCQRVLALKNNSADAWLLAGGILMELGRYHGAEDAYRQALKVDEKSFEAHYGIAEIMRQLGNNEAAVESCRQALRLNPGYVNALFSLGANQLALGEPEEALDCAQKIIAAHPDNPYGAELAASVLERKGDAEGAYNYLEPFVSKGILHENIALSLASTSGKRNCREEAIHYTQSILENKKLSVPNLRALHFSQGKLYDAIGEYDQAFKHFEQGNKLKGVNCDTKAHRKEVDRLISVVNRKNLIEIPRAGHGNRTPVFVVGMPRSGTTLVEQVLSSHPKVHGAGELPYLADIAKELIDGGGGLPEYPELLTVMNAASIDKLADRYLNKLALHAQDAEFIVDKMPGNYLYLGIIELLFPEAHVVYCKRNALDTCLSNYFQDFAAGQSFSYDLLQVGEVYLEHERLMEHWKRELDIPILEVQYEELVDNFDNLSREIIGFCDLEWDDQCLRFYETQRFVATASYDQVRKPVYKKSVERWRHYKEHLAGLRNLLESKSV